MDKMIEIPQQEYKKLIQMEARVSALMAYANRTKYGVDGELIGAILGIFDNEVEDGEIGESHGE